MIGPSDRFFCRVFGGKWKVAGPVKQQRSAAAMAGFDDPGVYYSEPFFSEDVSEDGEISRTAAVRRFKEFIKTFLNHENIYCYR